jgi:hypothetical protein
MAAAASTCWRRSSVARMRCDAGGRARAPLGARSAGLRDAPDSAGGGAPRGRAARRRGRGVSGGAQNPFGLLPGVSGAAAGRAGSGCPQIPTRRGGPRPRPGRSRAPRHGRGRSGAPGRRSRAPPARPPLLVGPHERARRARARAPPARRPAARSARGRRAPRQQGRPPPAAARRPPGQPPPPDTPPPLPPPKQQVVQKAADIQEAISEGANSFLFTEYKYLGVFGVRGPAWGGAPFGGGLLWGGARARPCTPPATGAAAAAGEWERQGAAGRAGRGGRPAAAWPAPPNPALTSHLHPTPPPPRGAARARPAATTRPRDSPASRRPPLPPLPDPLPPTTPPRLPPNPPR